MSGPWKDYAADAILRDGTSIHIRAIRPDDRVELARGFAELSPESVYFRFFRREDAGSPTTSSTSSPSSTSSAGRRWSRRCAIDDEERIIGVGALRRHRRRARAPHRPRWRSRSPIATRDAGSARCCSSTSRAIARANGITEFEADVLGENNRMLSVFAKSGFRVEALARRRRRSTSRSRPRRPPSTPPLIDQRERTAAAASVRGDPRSRARSRSSARRGSRARSAPRSSRTCVRAGFHRADLPGQPAAPTRSPGLPCHPHGRARSAQPVDLAVIAVPAAAVQDVVARLRRAPACAAWSSSRPASPRSSEDGTRRAARARRAGARLRHAHGRPELHGRAQHRSRGRR